MGALFVVIGLTLGLATLLARLVAPDMALIVLIAAGAATALGDEG